MIKKNVVTGLALLTACSCVHAQEWTEQAVLTLFEQQSPMKREARAAAVAAVEGLRSRTLWPNPVAAYTRETVGFTEFMQGEQQLPLSGRLGLARKALEPARETAEAEGEARVWEIRSSLRAAFFRALAAQRQDDVIQSSLTEIQEVVGLLRTREREGEGSPYDRMRVERETADLRADVALARSRSRSERTFLLSYLPPQTAMARLVGELAPRILPPAADEIVQRALNVRADVRAASSRLVQLALEQQAADRMKVPEPTITAGLKRTQLFGNQTGTGAVISVSIPLPFFNKGQTEVARLSAEQERVKARRDLIVQQITATVAGAYDGYAARREALAAFERETGDAGAELLRVARLGYQEGELGILPLLDAYRLKRQTALRLLELQLVLKESEVELSRAAGFEVMQ